MKIYLVVLLGLGCSSSLFAQEISLKERAKKQCRSVHLFHEDIPHNSKALFLEVKAT